MNLARWLAAAAVTVLGACAQRVLVPEVMLDNLDQRRAEAHQGARPRVEYRRGADAAAAARPAQAPAEEAHRPR